MDNSQHESRSVGGGVYALLAFGILLVVGAIALPILGLEAKVGLGAVFAMVAFGLALSLFATGLLVVAKLYVRTKASEAFVKTGKGGMVAGRFTSVPGCASLPQCCPPLPLLLAPRDVASFDVEGR